VSPRVAELCADIFFEEVKRLSDQAFDPDVAVDAQIRRADCETLPSEVMHMVRQNTSAQTPVEQFFQESENFEIDSTRWLTGAFARVVEAEKIARDDTLSGSTATIVLLAKPPTRNEPWKLTCAWVGNSRALVVGPDGKSVRTLTEDHRLDSESEKRRCLEVARSEDATSPNGKRRTVITNRVSTKRVSGEMTTEVFGPT
jgi:serine/threonine protein phosphatase PrpC